MGFLAAWTQLAPDHWLALAAVLAVPCGLYALLAFVGGSAVKNNIDPSFTLLSEATVSWGTYRLYQTNCGATCAYGLLLRKEFDTPLGIKVVSRIWSAYREEPATVQVTKDKTVEVVRGSLVLAAFKE